MPLQSGDSVEPIVLLTDFGYRDHYVGVMRGVISRLIPQARVIDLTHGVPPQQIRIGALVLAQSWSYFPATSVFVAVVDPGVGSARAAIAIKTRAGAHFVGPDNGVLWPGASAAGIQEAVELRNPEYRLSAVSSTFHGRDIFAPAAAWIARGVELSRFGPPRDRLIELDPCAGVIEDGQTLRGQVIYIDRFGNLVTNLDVKRLERFIGDRARSSLRVRLKNRATVRLGDNYASVPSGASVALIGSFELLEVAVRDGSALEIHAAAIGDPVILDFEPILNEH